MDGEDENVTYGFEVGKNYAGKTIKDDATIEETEQLIKNFVDELNADKGEGEQKASGTTIVHFGTKNGNNVVIGISRQYSVGAYEEYSMFFSENGVNVSSYQYLFHKRYEVDSEGNRTGNELITAVIDAEIVLPSDLNNVSYVYSSNNAQAIINKIKVTSTPTE